jgi:hypothetical protein
MYLRNKYKQQSVVAMQGDVPMYRPIPGSRVEPDPGPEQREAFLVEQRDQSRAEADWLRGQVLRLRAQIAHLHRDRLLRMATGGNAAPAVGTQPDCTQTFGTRTVGTQTKKVWTFGTDS